jgi:hypothetical protein
MKRSLHTTHSCINLTLRCSSVALLVSAMMLRIQVGSLDDAVSHQNSSLPYRQAIFAAPRCNRKVAFYTHLLSLGDNFKSDIAIDPARNLHFAISICASNIYRVSHIASCLLRRESYLNNLSFVCPPVSSFPSFPFLFLSATLLHLLR